MANYIPTIGLEIHAELKTKSKMFCASPNDPNEKHPNVNICPVCMGHPGTLPVINKQAVLHMLRIGFALGSSIPSHSKFDRKNYFYPDLPKGYQISQYDMPLCIGGYLDIPTEEESERKRVRITRVHLEEDTGKLVHPEGADYSLVDFNRAGVPLMELVTEPDIRSAKEAVAFAKELQRILRYLEASDADMEKGQMRVEVNISLRETRETEAKQEHETEAKRLGTKVEIKNLNSFRAVEGAVAYEIERQTELLEKGEKVVQETRGWNDEKQVTFSQRIKEEAHDYRYFPEPDLPHLELSPPYIDTKEVQLSVPELPRAKSERFKKEFALSPREIDILVEDRYFADFFEKTMTELVEWAKEKGIQKIDEKRLAALSANYAITDLQRLMSKEGVSARDLLVTPENFAELIRHVYEDKISSRVAKDVLQEVFKTGGDPSQIIHERGLFQVSDAGALEGIVRKVIEEHPGPVEDYKSGKTNAAQFLVGKVMEATKGKSNPSVVRELIEKMLS